MEKLTGRVKDLALSYGAVAVGIVNTEMLAGGPPSTDLAYVLPTAKTAVSFAVPLDQKYIEPWFNKISHADHLRNNIQKRYKMLTESGVVVENSDGSREAVSPGEAEKRLAALDPAIRALYEDI